MNFEVKYSKVVAHNAFLVKQFNQEKMRKEFLMKEVNVQNRVISQLKQLLLTAQTKPKCTLKHKSCNIDHAKYNYVKPATAQDQVSRKNFSNQTCKQSLSSVKMSRKIDKLQSLYGVPPPDRKNVSQDLIFSEFSSIWDNVLFFSTQCHKKYPR